MATTRGRYAVSASAAPLSSPASKYKSHGQINRDASPSRGSRRTLMVRVADASKMINPSTGVPLSDPVLYIGLGKLSESVSLSRHGDRFDPGDMVNMPYNGETILRLMLSDGVYQCGWADVPCDVNAFATDQEIPVKITSRHDNKSVCGVVTLGMKRSSARIQSNVNNDRTPLAKADYRPTTPDNSVVIDTTEPTTPVVTPDNHPPPPPPPPPAPAAEVQSVRVRVLTVSKLAKETENVYVMIEGAKKLELRGSQMPRDARGCVNYMQTFIFPAQEGDKWTLKVYENEKLQRDPLLGQLALEVCDGAVLCNGKRSSGSTEHELKDKKGALHGLVGVQVFASSRPETAGARVENDNMKARSESSEFDRPAAPLPPMESTVVDSEEEEEGLQEVVRDKRVLMNTLTVKVVKSFDEAPNAFVKTKLGKKSLRADEFGEAQGDELVFPYSSEKWLYFTSQQDVSMAKDPVTGVGKLDLTDLACAPPQTKSCVVEMYPKLSKKQQKEVAAGTLPPPKPVGLMNVSVTSSPDREVTKPTLRQGPDLDVASDIPKDRQPRSVQIDVVKLVDPPTRPGTQYKLACDYGSKTHAVSAVPAVVSPAGEVQFNHSFLSKNCHKKYAKVTVINAETEASAGHVYVNIDKGIQESPDTLHQASLSGSGGTCVYSVRPLDRALQNGARWVPTDKVSALKTCKSVELRVLAAYDLKYDSTKDVLDPYCVVSHGSEVNLEGKPRKNAGLNPVLMTTYTFPVMPGEPIKLSVFDKATLHKDTLIGSCVADMDLLEEQQLLALMKDGAPAGSLLVTLAPLNEVVKKGSTKQDALDDKTIRSTDLIKFNENSSAFGLPTWEGLNVHLICARNLGGTPAPADKDIDPIFTVYNGKDHKAESQGYKNSSLSPTINKHFAFPRSNARILRFDVVDKKMMGKKMIGSGNIDLVELQQVLYNAKKGKNGFDELSSSDSDDTSDTVAVLQKQVELFDDYGRPAGALFVHVTPSQTKVGKAECLDMPPTKAMRKLGMPTCTTGASSCTIRIAEGENIDAEAHPFVKLSWMKKSTRTRTLTTADSTGRRLWQDDMILPCIPAQTEMTFTLTDNVKMARDHVLGTATITDVEKILNCEKPTERWVEFVEPESKRSAGKVHMIFTPSDHIEEKLMTVPSSEAIPNGTYNSVKVTIIDGEGLAFDHGKDLCDPFLSVKHDTTKLKGKVHKDAGVNPQILESYTLPVRPGYPIEISVSDDNKLSGDVLIGTGKLSLPDLIRKQPETGISGQLPISLNGKTTGHLNYIMTLHKELCDSPKVEVAPKNARISTTVTGVGEEGDSHVSLYEALDIEVVKFQDVPVTTGGEVDPYVYVILGAQKLRGHTVEKCSTGSGSVGDIFHLLYEPVEFMKFEIYDDQKLRRDPVLASAKLSLNTIVTSSKYREMQRLKLPLYKADGSSGGNLFMKVRGHESPIYSKASVETSAAAPALERSSSEVSSHGATKLSVKCDYESVRVEVLNACNIGTSDPYVVARVGKHSLRSHTVVQDDDAGALGAADFGDVFYFPYEGEQKMKVTVFDNRKFRRDEELGYCKLDLAPLVGQVEPTVITGQLVNKKTGQLTRGEVTFIISPQKTALTKPYAVKPDAQDEDEVKGERVVCVQHPKSCLVLEDLKVTGLAANAAGNAALQERFNPYVITKLGKAKLRSNKLRDDGRVNEGMMFNMTKAPDTLAVDLMNNVKFHPDDKLYSGKIQTTTFNAPEGQFTMPLTTEAGGVGPALVGEYRWCDRVMKKKAQIIVTPESAREAGREAGRVSEKSVPVRVGGDAPASYTVTIEQGVSVIPGGEKPYALVTMEGGKSLRFDEAFNPRAQVTEHGHLPSTHIPILHVQVRDNRSLRVDPLLLEGLVDVSDLRPDQQNTYPVKCTHPDGTSYQEIDLIVQAHSNVINKQYISTTPNANTAPTSIPAVSAPSAALEVLSDLCGYDAVEVEMTRLSDLKKVDTFSKNDPYVVVTYGGEELKSDVFKNAGQNDVMINTSFHLPLPTRGAERHLTVTLMDKETIGKDKNLGHAKIDLLPILQSHKTNKLQIQISNKNTHTGTIDCSIKFNKDTSLVRPKIVKVNYA